MARPHLANFLAAAIASATLAGFIPGAHAQPADLPIPAAKTTEYPSGIRVGKVGGKTYYLDRQGRVLYGMDMRVLLRAGPDPAQYCTGECAATWEPLLAPAGSKPNIAYPRGPARLAVAAPGFHAQPQLAPDWTIISGPQGPQWVYKGWHMVFARRGAGARSDQFDGTDERTWNTLKFVPPVPEVVAPPEVRAIARDGGYVLADSAGRLLFTGTCTKNCIDWLPLRAGMASAAVGAWRALTDADVTQWTWRGKPVYVCPEDAPSEVPTGGKVLQP
jgi:predicted lipoprotein with Yx(FWY)xxD motif